MEADAAVEDAAPGALLGAVELTLRKKASTCRLRSAQEVLMCVGAVLTS